MPVDDDNVKEGQEEVSSSGNKKIVYILAGLIGVVVFVTAVILITLFISKSLREEQVGKQQEIAADVREPLGSPLNTRPLSTEPMNFNLKPDQTGRSRLLQVTIVFAFDSRRASSEIEDRESQLRDVAIRYFGRKTPEEVSVENFDTVKRELLSEFRQNMQSEIKTIYFSNYMLLR